MKAVRFHRHGGPEVLRYEDDAPDPVPENGEALVRVRACALNHLDLWARNGLPNVKIPLPHISGSDISGVVEWVPDGEREFKKGAEVIVNPGISCGRTNLIAKPSEMDFVEAASFPLVFLTAYHMLVNKARVQAGESVLVLGAGSGVGSAAIQVAKLFGANVIATAGEDEKLVKAKELGADQTINHRTQDIAEEARKLTGKLGVDVVVEHVGEATWEKSLRSLAKGGRLVTCGATTGAEGITDLRYVFSRELSLHGSYMGSKGELLKVVELFRGGKLKKVVDSVYPLKDAHAAQERMERSEHFGKIVLTV